MSSKQKIITGIFIIILILAAITATFIYQQLQIQRIKEKQTVLEPSSEVQVLAAEGRESTLASLLASDTSAVASLSGLQQQIEALSLRVSQLEKRLGMATQKTTANPPVKEYVIFLGTGQTNNRDWTDLTSAVTTINSSNYGELQAVYFEAALSIIGGEAHARLMNQTTGQIYYQTEVENNTSNSEWITSSAFPLTSGSNAYLVQLLSTSGELAILNGARIHLYIR